MWDGFGGLDMAAYDDKAGAGPVAGLLLLAGLGLPVLWRAGASCREAQECVENLEEGYHGQRGGHCRDGVGDKMLEACEEEARYHDGQDMAGGLGRGGRVEVDGVQLLGLIGLPRDGLGLCCLCGGWRHGDGVDERHLGGLRGRIRGRGRGAGALKRGIGSGTGQRKLGCA